MVSAVAPAQGLAGERDASARAEQTAQLAGLLDRVGPEPDRVHRDDSVERLVEAWQPVHGHVQQFDPLGVNGSGVALAGLTKP